MHLEQIMIKEMQDYFRDDERRINHAKSVLKYAKEIMGIEGGNGEVIIASAIFHDIGIHECERKYNSTSGQLQEKESPPITRRILENLNCESFMIDEVCQIIASHHSQGEVNTLNFRIIWDSDLLVNIKEGEYKNRDKLKDLFMTKTGGNIFKELHLE